MYLNGFGGHHEVVWFCILTTIGLIEISYISSCFPLNYFILLVIREC